MMIIIMITNYDDMIVMFVVTIMMILV